MARETTNDSPKKSTDQNTRNGRSSDQASFKG